MFQNIKRCTFFMEMIEDYDLIEFVILILFNIGGSNLHIKYK
jgi:hypothetical protein